MTRILFTVLRCDVVATYYSLFCNGSTLSIVPGLQFSFFFVWPSFVFPLPRCRLRIVDSFGTEAQFNHLTDKALKTSFGSHDLQLKQFNTMFRKSSSLLLFLVSKIPR